LNFVKREWVNTVVVVVVVADDVVVVVVVVVVDVVVVVVVVEVVVVCRSRDGKNWTSSDLLREQVLHGLNSRSPNWAEAR